MTSSAPLKNRPITCRVRSTREEAEDIKTLRIKSPPYICRNARPGQFLMVWIPGVDEVPMSISSIAGEDEVWITVKKVGEATSAIHRIATGGVLGLRGPYGTSFSVQGRDVLVVGGGIGAAPLLFLTKKLIDKGRRITAVLGARSIEKLVLRKDFERLLEPGDKSKVIAATDDGSSGIKGCASDVTRDLIEKGKFDKIYTCGPEPMIQRILIHAADKGVEVEASLERYMRCGIGLCGSCYVGKCLVCKDGPVFAGGKLKHIAKHLKRE